MVSHVALTLRTLLVSGTLLMQYFFVESDRPKFVGKQASECRFSFAETNRMQELKSNLVE